jgi:hypothetical protein
MGASKTLVSKLDTQAAARAMLGGLPVVPTAAPGCLRCAPLSAALHTRLVNQLGNTATSCHIIWSAEAGAKDSTPVGVGVANLESVRFT